MTQTSSLQQASDTRSTQGRQRTPPPHLHQSAWWDKKSRRTRRRRDGRITRADWVDGLRSASALSASERERERRRCRCSERGWCQSKEQPGGASGLRFRQNKASPEQKLAPLVGKNSHFLLQTEMKDADFGHGPVCSSPAPHQTPLQILLQYEENKATL